MASEESTRRGSASLTDEQAERMLTDLNDVIRAGEEARRLRAEMIRMLVDHGWTQEKIARLSDMSQPAVSKQVAKHRAGEPAPPMDLALDQHDAPWLEGRLWGLAEALAETVADGARCARLVHAIARGRKRFTPGTVDELRRLVEEDLRLRRAELPDDHRAAYDEISRGLDVPPKASGAAEGPAGPPSVRRALAHRIQRDRLGGTGPR
ncbi:sigma-70 family RNA polymerase sigma factor [Streptomyces sp. CA-243310]|uniref:sigma-70 family RNA polymerase sigma factor n=1 Tax=Streptomyces sp. CA-243310 TaxID=3240056 RepID=UPI003D945215